jgi:hypothetical protein
MRGFSTALLASATLAVTLALPAKAEPASLCETVPKGVFDRDWLCDELAAVGEPDHLSRAGTAQSFRMLYSRSFHPAILIRINLVDDGSGSMIVKERAVHDTRVTVDSMVFISAADTNDLRATLSRDSFWTAPVLYHVDFNFGPYPVNKPAEAVIMSDGAAWFIEGADPMHYRIMADDGGAFASPVQDIGMALLTLAKKKVPSLDIEPIY